MNNMYYVKVEDADGNITTHIVKECDVDAYFSYEKSTGVVKYGEHYIGKNYKNLFNNKGYSNGMLYIDAIDDTLVSVATGSFWYDGKSFLSILDDAYLTDEVDKKNIYKYD